MYGMRKPIIMVIYLFLCISIYAQQSYSVNEHGTYVIDSGRIIKVPISKWEDYGHFFHGFWEDIAVFQYYYDLKGIVIFNIKSGAVTEIVGEWLEGPPVILRNYVYFSILYGAKGIDYIYKFDKTTLELVDKIYAGSMIERKYNYQNWEPINEEKIGERRVRYTTNNGKYIDVIYGPKVEMVEWWNFFVYYDSKLNRYAITVKLDDGK